MNNKEYVNSLIFFTKWHKCIQNVRLCAVKRRRHMNSYFESYGCFKMENFAEILKNGILINLSRKPITF